MAIILAAATLVASGHLSAAGGSASSRRPLVTEGKERLGGSHAVCAGLSGSEKCRSQRITVLYLVAGGVVAATHHYWSHLQAVKPIASAILATLLRPLHLVGIDLHIH